MSYMKNWWVLEIEQMLRETYRRSRQVRVIHYTQEITSLRKIILLSTRNFLSFKWSQTSHRMRATLKNWMSMSTSSTSRKTARPCKSRSPSSTPSSSPWVNSTTWWPSPWTSRSSISIFTSSQWTACPWLCQQNLAIWCSQTLSLMCKRRRTPRWSPRWMPSPRRLTVCSRSF